MYALTVVCNLVKWWEWLFVRINAEAPILANKTTLEVVSSKNAAIIATIKAAKNAGR